MLLAALLASIALVGVHVALGGGDYEPAPPPDPCAIRAPDAQNGTTATLERVGLTALAASACELGVSRERLLLALTGEEDIGVSGERRTQAFRAGVRKALEEEARAGRIGATEASFLLQAVEILPVDTIIEQLFG
jgi:hypothetical protein